MIDIVWSPRGWITSFHSRLANNKQQEFKKSWIYNWAVCRRKYETRKHNSLWKRNIVSNTVRNHLYINIHIHTNIFTQIILFSQNVNFKSTTQTKPCKMVQLLISSIDPTFCKLFLFTDSPHQLKKNIYWYL